MSWKCPACGNSDNLDESLRCICGYEVKTGEPKINTVKPEKIEIHSFEKYTDKKNTIKTEIFTAKVLVILMFSVFLFWKGNEIVTKGYLTYWDIHAEYGGNTKFVGYVFLSGGLALFIYAAISALQKFKSRSL